MTDTQLYFAIGVPSVLVMLNFFGSLLVILWQSRSIQATLGARIDALEKVMGAKFEIVDAKFDAVYARFDAAGEGLRRVEDVIDARLKHLEER